MSDVPFYRDARWIIPTALAIWGALLSTYSFVAQRLDKQPKLNVSLVFMPTLPATGPLDPPPKDDVVITVKNTGRTEEFFKNDCCWVQMNGDTRLTGVTQLLDGAQFPVVLKAGDAFRLTFSLYEVPLKFDRKKDQMRASVTDALSRRFESEWARHPWALLKGMF